jgi:hypothetical protein
VGNAGGVSCWFADPEGSDGFYAFVHDGQLVHHIRHLFYCTRLQHMLSFFNPAGLVVVCEDLFGNWDRTS